MRILYSSPTGHWIYRPDHAKTQLTIKISSQGHGTLPEVAVFGIYTHGKRIADALETVGQGERFLKRLTQGARMFGEWPRFLISDSHENNKFVWPASINVTIVPNWMDPFGDWYLVFGCVCVCVCL
jgi:hypothetical protein